MYRNFDLDTLEREYSPSSCIDDNNIYIEQYINQSRQATALASSQNSLVADLSYGERPEQLIDLYLPTTDNGNNPKLQVYIHGGYWQELSKAESSFAATNFQQHGCHFAVINYSLAPDVSLSEIVEQNRQAIAWLYQNATRFAYDPEQIYLSGSSAGAHLAMMMLQTDWAAYFDNHGVEVRPKCDPDTGLVKGVCAVSGVYDLTPLVDTCINDALRMTRAEAQANSPLALVLPAQPPVILAFGEVETSEFKRQSGELAYKLIRNGNEICCQQISNRNHFDVILGLANSDSWLCQQVFAQMGLSRSVAGDK